MWKQKSLDMKNLFLSPSKSPDFTKIFIKLNMIQAEQRHARADLKMILNEIHTIIESIQETSPQTDSEEHIPEEELT